MTQEAKLTRLIPEYRAYAMSLVAEKQFAEDLVQDALERALRAPNRPKRSKDLRPWMFKIIRNLHLDELRKYRVRREYAAREARSLSEGSGQNQDRDVLVRLAFERLPSDKKEVLLLVDVIGLKYAEAAEVMDVAVGTVMSRLSRARRALAEEVGEFRDKGPLRGGKSK